MGENFDGDGESHAATHTEGSDSASLSLLLWMATVTVGNRRRARIGMRETMEVVHQGDEDTGAAAAKGVTQGNGAAAHVGTLLRQAELVQDLRRKRRSRNQSFGLLHDRAHCYK